MPGYFSILLHAHLPFVRHPEHDRFLEESWLFEAVAGCYLPLLEVVEGWQRDGVPGRITLSLSPTLCSMLQDPLLQHRCDRHLKGLVELAGKEVLRTHWQKPLRELAEFYYARFTSLHARYQGCGADLVQAFRRLQDADRIEVITCPATHAVLPLLAVHPPAMRAQVMIARDQYRACFGRDPRGIWLPECAYAPGVEDVLRAADIRWFVVDTHGLLLASPRPHYRVCAPVFTAAGVAAFGRDLHSARQVWSRDEGYPGDPRYRDFYRDVGFDLDLGYVRPYLPAPDVRTFTGIKYHRITGKTDEKEVYRRAEALQAVESHATHFIQARADQISRLAAVMDRPPIMVAPYDAELFGHWWFEGPEFLDLFVRKAAQTQREFALITPTDYLRLHPNNQVSTPAASTWGEGGHLKVWLGEQTASMHRHLRVAQQRMSELADQHPKAEGLLGRALKQAGRELLLAQASDWAFIIHTGTSPEYARKRFQDHLSRFLVLHDQITRGQVDEGYLSGMEAQDNLLPEVDCSYWRTRTDIP